MAEFLQTVSAPATALGWALAPSPMTLGLGVATCAVVVGVIVLTTLLRSNPEGTFDQSTAQLRADSVVQASAREASPAATALAVSGDKSGIDASQAPQIALHVTDPDGAPDTPMIFWKLQEESHDEVSSPA